MGADMLITFARVPENVDIDLLKGRAESISEDERLYVLETLDFYSDDERSGQDPVELLKDAIDEVFCSPSRELADVHIDGKRYLFTGGLSWGDLPTEIFQSLSLIHLVTEGV
jgi:hypothetical protein